MPHPAYTSRLALLAACSLLAGGAGAAPLAIKLNQVGFLPAAQKLAVVPAPVPTMMPATAPARFSVIDAASGKPVFDGSLAPAASWNLSGERVRLADFSAVRTPGSYRIRVAGLPDSALFNVSLDVYRALDTAAIRSFTLNRAGIELRPRWPVPGRARSAIRIRR